MPLSMPRALALNAPGPSIRRFSGALTLSGCSTLVLALAPWSLRPRSQLR
jgi:hypothetical protein